MSNVYTIEQIVLAFALYHRAIDMESDLETEIKRLKVLLQQAQNMLPSPSSSASSSSSSSSSLVKKNKPREKIQEEEKEKEEEDEEDEDEDEDEEGNSSSSSEENDDANQVHSPRYGVKLPIYGVKRPFHEMQQSSSSSSNKVQRAYSIKKHITLAAPVRAKTPWLQHQHSVKKLPEKKTKNFKLALPFNGKIDANKCNAIVPNYKLYTQCKNNHLDGNAFCRNHDKTGPTYGTIQERKGKALYGEWSMEVNGRKLEPIRYAEYMNINQQPKSEVLKLAKKKGITLDEEHFVGLAKTLGGDVDDEDVQLSTQPKPKRKYNKRQRVEKEEEKKADTDEVEMVVEPVVTVEPEEPEQKEKEDAMEFFGDEFEVNDLQLDDDEGEENVE
jgi:hypothetical protein